MNTLYFGDNLEVLRDSIADASVDLVYLDPPFNSGANYNIIFQPEKKSAAKATAQIQAFEDTWTWSAEADETYRRFVIDRDLTSQPPGERLIKLMTSMREYLGETPMMAYLTMMAPRLLELRRVLKDTGSIYLHCDPTASHYLKMLMDGVFGGEHFVNEIDWRRTGAHNSTRSFGAIHDVILFYSKSSNHTFNILRRPYMKRHVESRYEKTSDGRMRFTSGGNVLTGAGATAGDSAKPWRGFDPAAKGRHWAVPSFYESLMPVSYRDLISTQKLEALYQAHLITIDGTSVWPTMVRFLDERDGTPIQDMWAYQPYTEGAVWGTDKGIDSDVAWLGPTDPDRLGYPTQKPQGLLERIVQASSNEGDVVLDPFCGCGTAVAAAQKLDRQWVASTSRTCLSMSSPAG